MIPRTCREPVSVCVLLFLIPCCGAPTSPSVPNVQGFWVGGWAATTCTTTLPVQIPCQNNLEAGSTYLRLVQSETAVHGFLHVCGSEADQVNGTVATNGVLTITGSGSLPFNAPITASLTSTVSGTVMTGSFACVLDIGGYPFSMTGILKDVTLFSRDPNTPF